jgi:hypothetical protein
MKLQRNFFLLISLLGSAVVPMIASAQLQVSLDLDRHRYIRYEPLVTRVTVRNDTGNDLDFSSRPDGTETGFLTFEISDPQSKPIRPFSKSFNPMEGLYLAAGATRTIEIPLQKHFNMQRAGDYQIKARVGHMRMANDYLSKPIQMEVGSGQPLWERNTGVPTKDPNAVIGKRRCSINVFHSKLGDVLYLQIEDERTVYTVNRLGPSVRGVQPSCDFDSLARLHILLQVAPRLFRYNVFDLSGKKLHEHVYLLEEVLPRLHRDPDVGRVMVVGGRIAEEGIDYNVESNITMTLREVPKTILPTGDALAADDAKPEQESTAQKKPFWKRLLRGKE